MNKYSLRNVVAVLVVAWWVATVILLKYFLGPMLAERLLRR